MNLEQEFLSDRALSNSMIAAAVAGMYNARGRKTWFQVLDEVADDLGELPLDELHHTLGVWFQERAK